MHEIVDHTIIKVIRKFFLHHNKSFRWHLSDYEKHIFFCVDSLQPKIRKLLVENPRNFLVKMCVRAGVCSPGGDPVPRSVLAAQSGLGRHRENFPSSNTRPCVEISSYTHTNTGQYRIFSSVYLYCMKRNAVKFLQSHHNHFLMALR